MKDNPGKTTDYLNHVHVSISVISVKFPPFYNPIELEIQPQPCPVQRPDVHTAYKESRQRALERLLDELSGKELVGRGYAEQYLRDQYRRGCRPNTMRSSAKGIELFLTFLANTGKAHARQITREDLYGFIEQEQDRGLKPRAVDTRLRSVKAFLRFLIDQEVVDPRVLPRKITIKVIDPDDVKRDCLVLSKRFAK